MRKKKHSGFRKYLGLIVLGVCIKAPDWLGSVWPLFTDKTIPDWINERRWPMTSQIFSHWATVVGFAGILGYIAWDVFRTKPPTPKESVSKQKKLFQITELSHSRNESRLYPFAGIKDGKLITRFEKHEVDFLGFFLKNCSGKTLRGCEVKFTKLERALGHESLCEGVPTVLPYRPNTARERSEEPIVKRDINPDDIEQACLCTLHDDGTIHLGSSPVPTWSESVEFNSFFEGQGKYRFHIQITTVDEAPALYVFTLDWTGKKDTSGFLFPPEEINQAASR
jgi:hypothetical protein